MWNWKEEEQAELKGLARHLQVLLKWAVLSAATGVIVGLIGVAFHEAVAWAAAQWQTHHWLLFLLPAAGIAIAGMYRAAGIREDRGANLVLSAVRSGSHLAFRTAPLVFAATTLTHLCGGSSGREGAALQIGGSVASSVSWRLGFREEDQRILVVCGMAAAFSALFGTPLTAAVFALEVEQVGMIYYAALVPALLSSLTAFLLAGQLGVTPTAYIVSGTPQLAALPLMQCVLFGALCGLIAIVFYTAMHAAHAFYDGVFRKNSFVIAAVGGILIQILTVCTGGWKYNGAGGEIIADAVAGNTAPYVFFVKIIFTALTLGAGFKGGEIVPAFCTGAAFGCAVGPVMGLSASFAAACGIVGVFCGVTNCPLSSMFLAYELFGGEGIALYAVICAVSYLVSGYGGLYSEQKIMYSKSRLGERVS